MTVWGISNRRPKQSKIVVFLGMILCQDPKRGTPSSVTQNFCNRQKMLGQVGWSRRAKFGNFPSGARRDHQRSLTRGRKFPAEIWIRAKPWLVRSPSRWCRALATAISARVGTPRNLSGRYSTYPRNHVNDASVAQDSVQVGWQTSQKPWRPRLPRCRRPRASSRARLSSLRTRSSGCVCRLAPSPSHHPSWVGAGRPCREAVDRRPTPQCHRWTSCFECSSGSRRCW